ncbi:MAG TPA: ribonuclease J, partial [Mariprofundaceae bacterium]|nr:ribonuclease J [Mariprofundaceae bacterium]
ALARMTKGQFPGFQLNEGDLIVFSSSMIPGNERTIAGLFNHIYRRGARVIHAGQAPLHVSGHAQAHELTTMIQLTRPKYFYPVHGEYRNLVEHKHLAMTTGIAEENTIIAENGQSVEIHKDGLSAGDVFHAGAVFVDGTNRDEIDDLVLRDRRVLAQEGMVTAIVIISKQEGRLIGTPELLARGLLHQEVGDEVLARAGRELQKHLESAGQEWLADDDAAKEEVRIWLRRWFKRNAGKRPMALPVVLEV